MMLDKHDSPFIIHCLHSNMSLCIMELHFTCITHLNVSIAKPLILCSFLYETYNGNLQNGNGHFGECFTKSQMGEIWLHAKAVWTINSIKYTTVTVSNINRHSNTVTLYLSSIGSTMPHSQC